MSVALVFDGVACSASEARDAPTAFPAAELASGARVRDVDVSDARRFAGLSLDAGALVVSHGGFLRALARLLAPDDAALHARLEAVRKRTLWILRATVGGAPVLLMRHCARADRARLFPARDPACARDGAHVCRHAELRAALLRLVPRGAEVYSSCLRRAVETAHAVIAALRDAGREVNATPRVLPFVREETNWLGPWDASNRCARDVLARLRPPASPTRAPTLRIVRVKGDGNCLFRALLRASGVALVTHAAAYTLRMQVVAWLRDHWEDALVDGLTPAVMADAERDAYLAAIRQDGAHGGQLELLAAERVLGRPVCVVQAGNKAVLHGTPRRAGTVYLLYGGNHYDALEPV